MFEILTENGFKPFDGIISRGTKKTILLELSNGKTLRCTPDHQLRMKDEYGEAVFIECMFLDVDDVLYNDVRIISKTEIDDAVDVYDALNVKDTHSYISDGVVSHNCNVLMLDEFAFLSNNLADEFIASVFPTLSSSKESKLVITSTPNGLNAFYKIWKEAQDGINDFVAVRGYWNELHNQEWADKQRKLLGEVRYTAEVECVSKDTTVEVKDTITGEIKEISIGDLYDELNEKQNLNDKYLIKTPYGFVSFDGITKKQGRSAHIQFDNTILKCSLTHKVQLLNGKFIDAKYLKPGNIVLPNSRVVSIKIIDELDLFDLVNVNNKDNSYYTNNVVSHNCEFLGSSNTLVDGKFLATIPFSKPIYSKNSLNEFEQPIKSHSYVMTVDVARGRGLDHSAFIVFDITEMPFKVVATYKNNSITAVEFPLIIKKIAEFYNEALVVIENNDLGESVCNTLWYDLEYVNMIWTDHGEITSTGGNIGIRTTNTVKKKGSSKIATIIEQNQIILNDFRIIQELQGYSLQKTGVYAAEDTNINDDLCTCLFLFGWLTNDPFFESLTGFNNNQKLTHQFESEVDDIQPIGFFSNGSDDDLAYQVSQDQRELLMV